MHTHRNQRVLALDARRQALFLNVNNEVFRLDGPRHRERDVKLGDGLLPFVRQGRLLLHLLFAGGGVVRGVRLC